MLPGTMRQVKVATSGGPDAMHLGHARLPEPGSGQVLVKIAAAGVTGMVQAHALMASSSHIGKIVPTRD